MNISTPSEGTEIADKLLCGLQLDTLRVYSLIVQLGFIRLHEADGLPDEVWGVFSCDVAVRSQNHNHHRNQDSFIDRRAAALRGLYLLIGLRVSKVNIIQSGDLEIEFGEATLTTSWNRDVNLEECWSLMSDSPNTDADHAWYLGLDEFGALSLKTPTPRD
jgi:hypothetical protein